MFTKTVAPILHDVRFTAEIIIEKAVKCILLYYSDMCLWEIIFQCSSDSLQIVQGK